jgi:hypothetical protein
MLTKSKKVEEQSWSSWIALGLLNTPKWRLQRDRVMLQKRLVDLKLQYNFIYEKYVQTRTEYEGLEGEYKTLRLTLNELVKHGPLSSTDKKQLHNIHRIYGCAKSKHKNVMMYDMILMQIVTYQTQIRESLDEFDLAEAFYDVNRATKYAMGFDLTSSSHLIEKEVKKWLKRTKTDDVLGDHLKQTSKIKDAAIEIAQLDDLTVQKLVQSLVFEDALNPQIKNVGVIEDAT